MTSTSAAENPPKTQAPLPLRILVLLVGMAFAAFGIAAVTSAALGTTPISSVPVVLADMTGLTFGTVTEVREGTFVSAVMVGMLVKAIQKRLDARNARKTEEA